VGGGHVRRRSRRQHGLAADESGNAPADRHGVGLTGREAFHSRCDGRFRIRVQAVIAQGYNGPRIRRGRRLSLKQKLSLVRRAMRRFDPAASRVRRLRSSFTIATFPGRNARTVSGYNRRPNRTGGTSGRLCPAARDRSPEDTARGRLSTTFTACGARLDNLFGRARIRGVLQRTIIDG
jgi:hypothetical protein